MLACEPGDSRRKWLTATHLFPHRGSGYAMLRRAFALFQQPRSGLSPLDPWSVPARFPRRSVDSRPLLPVRSHLSPLPELARSSQRLADSRLLLFVYLYACPEPELAILLQGSAG